jgi:hypothetical protein
MAPNPLLRLALRAEKAASGPVNRAANSDEAAGVLLLVSRLLRVAGGMTGRIRAVAVRAVALPSHRDLQMLEAKVERLQRTLDEWVASSYDERNGR